MSRIFSQHTLVPKDGHAKQLFVILPAPQTELEGINDLLKTLADEFQEAAIVMISAKWSEQDIQIKDNDVLKDRVKDYAPEVLDYIQKLQAHFSVESTSTALVGIGLGGSIMHYVVAHLGLTVARLACFNSSLSVYPQSMSEKTTTHILYSERYPQVSPDKMNADIAHLSFIEADCTVDHYEDVVACLDPFLSELMLQRLKNTIPMRLIKEIRAARAAAEAAAEEAKDVETWN